MKNPESFNQEKDENQKSRKATRMSQHLAAASSMGYNLLGASVWEHPGVAPKALAIGLALKGAGDYRRAYDMEPILVREPRLRAREIFNQFAEAWAQNDGTSLKDRLKRKIGQDLGEFKDRTFSMRFNRMMGGLAMGMAGMEISLSAGSNAERWAGAAIMTAGVMEQMHNTQEGVNRSTELHQQVQTLPIEANPSQR